ncbi:MAG TPA: oxygenase MpaB family protein [Acidimicrobiales bacterium]|jgi:uncharacterized protein (DUF2236 family)|nr:oxygenase MpaB family protein [Acidimicrobiales bacterium]
MSAPGPGLFAPDSVVRRVNRESVLLLGGGRALLMQLAHPKVAQGVAEHSDFQSNPFARLQRTLEATYTIVFGSAEAAERTAAVVQSVHTRVRGDGYEANDPALLLWVHATLVDTAMRVYRRFVQPLSDDDAEAYYRDSRLVAAVLGCPLSAQPETLEEFRSYVRGMVGSLEVGDQAKALAREVLHPRAPWIAGPAFELGRQLTVGLLPRPLREGYGLGWDGPRQAALLAAGASSRLVLPRLPAFARRAPALF